jgi:serine/threonine protein phosphatase PrpC
MKILAYGRTEKGDSHIENEDSILIDQERNLYAVADGVTLPHGGRRASRRTIEYLGSLFDGDLEKTVETLNEKLLLERQKDPMMGTTTLTAAHVRGDELLVVHIGDSSAYKISAGKIKRITQPDNVPGTHMLIQIIGQSELVPHSYKEKMSPGDFVVLATDGVTDAVSDEELAATIRKVGDVKTIVDEVFSKVDRKPRLYKDDKSMIVISV